MKKTYNILVALLASTLLAACTVNPPLQDPMFEPTQAPAEMLEPNINGSIFSDSNNRFLFEDIKARRIGDLITVLLDENTNATKSASTNTSKNTAIAMPSPTLFGLTPKYKGKEFLNNSVDSDLAFKGGADSTQSNRLQGSITVTIAAVYPNGNMLVRGEKILTLNQGSEVVRISGIVRPSDVTPDNTVQSTHIANAQITYSGSGPLADSNTPGWLTQFLGSVIWPF